MSIWKDTRLVKYLKMMCEGLGCVTHYNGIASYNPDSETYAYIVKTFKEMSEEEKNNFNF